MTNFQFLVKESNKSLTEISRETGISYSTLGNYNQGTRTPKKKNAKILADYFGVSIPYLLGLDDNKQILNWTGEKMNTNIPTLISESNKKLTEISSKTGIPYPTLSGYNQGIRIPKRENAEKLADYFGVSVPYLLGRDDNKQILDCIGEKLMKYDELSIGQKLLVEAKVISKNDLSTDEGVVRLRVLGVGFVDILKTEIEQTIIYPLNEENKL